MIEYIEIIWEGVGGETSGVCWTFATVVVAFMVLYRESTQGITNFLFFTFFISSFSFLLVKNILGRRV